jgi:hypothetical protein
VLIPDEQILTALWRLFYARVNSDHGLDGTWEVSASLNGIVCSGYLRRRYMAGIKYLSISSELPFDVERVILATCSHQ